MPGASAERRGTSLGSVLRWLLVAGVLALSLLSAPPASAHSELQRSDPLDGGMVPVGRDYIDLWFGQLMAPSSSTFVVRAEDGSVVPTTVSGSQATTYVRVSVPPLTRQIYTLKWQVFSLEDGHTTSGTITFGAGVRPPTESSQGSQLPSAAYFLVKWSDLTALMLAIGALAVGDRALRPLGKKSQRRARTLGFFAALGAVYAGALTPFMRGFDMTNGFGLWFSQTWMLLTQTGWGQLWIAREAAVVVAFLSLWIWSRRIDRPTIPARLAGVALLSAAALDAWAGHSSSLPSDTIPMAVSSAAHLLAAGVWAGGLIVLVVASAPVLRKGGEARLSALSTMWSSFSPMAAVASVVLLASGLYETGHHLPSLSAVTSTFYGGVVGAKTLLIVLALALAGLNTLVVHPGIARWIAARLPAPLGRVITGRARRGPLVRTVRVEALALSVALVLAAALVSSATSREVVNARTPSTVNANTVDGLFITFEEVPAGPGYGRLLVRISDIIRPNPAPVEEVDVDLSGPDGQQWSVPLVPDAAEVDLYDARTTEPGPGDWTATIWVHRSGAVETVATSTWNVPSKAADGYGPFRIATTALAAILLAVLVTGVWIRRRNRRRRQTRPPDPHQQSESPRVPASVGS